jgi:hypothetical protein
MCGHLASVLQQFNEEQAAKRMFVSRKTPPIPTIMYEEKVHGTPTRPMFYGNRSFHSKHDTVQRKNGPGPLSRCRGCGSPDRWLRDGKCSGKDVVQFIKRRLSNSQSPAQVLHELCFDDSDEEDFKNKNEDSPHQSELCANFVVTEDSVPTNEDNSICETLVASSARHQISEHMDRTDETEETESSIAVKGHQKGAAKLRCFNGACLDSGTKICHWSSSGKGLRSHEQKYTCI